MGKRELKRHEAAKLFDFLGIQRQPDFQSVPLIGLASAGAWNETVTTPARHTAWHRWQGCLCGRD
ncbi:hypothetical protein AB5I41_31305 [Sphingomonas sp. MMS24-JH45]